METIKVLVADDHPAFREGLCHFLENEKGLEVVAKATDGEEAIRLSKELLPDVAIIDVAMPERMRTNIANPKMRRNEFVMSIMYPRSLSGYRVQFFGILSVFLRVPSISVQIVPRAKF